MLHRGALSYPWLAGVPALNQDFLLERYQAEALRCGVGAAPHMEVDVAEDEIEAETRHVEALAQRPASPLRGGRRTPEARAFAPAVGVSCADRAASPNDSPRYSLYGEAFQY